MATISAKHKVAAGLAALYGALSITGGIFGYVNKGSSASLYAGCGAGAVLLLCAIGTFKKPTVAMIVAALASIALLGRFVPLVIRSFDDAESSASDLAVLIGRLMVVGGVLVLFSSAFALSKSSGG
ncbi:MAG: TMEM14 family protein [Gemmataceae bacterium]|nr:TMEM14 family protein [Gemmataceae bacterium]